MKHLKPVEDKSEVMRLRDLMDPMVLAPHLLSPCWIRDQKWIAVPVEEKPYDDRIEWVCKAARLQGVRDCVVGVNESPAAIRSQEDMGLPSAYRLDLCAEGLVEVNANEYLWQFVLFPEHRSFAILQCDLYYIVAGPRDFVTMAVGGSLSEAWAEIEEACSSELSSNQPAGQVLSQIIREYRPNCLESPDDNRGRMSGETITQETDAGRNQ